MSYKAQSHSWRMSCVMMLHGFTTLFDILFLGFLYFLGYLQDEKILQINMYTKIKLISGNGSTL